MTDSLKLFVDGNPITAEDTNDNNQYLDRRINNCATTAYVEQQISSINTQVSNTVKITGNQTVQGTKTFSSSPILPTPAASDNSTKGATTAWVKSVLSSSGNGFAIFSKSGNGYIKLANGILIQWGSSSTHQSDSRYTNVTYPQPFTSSTSYKVIPTMFMNGMDNNLGCCIYSRTETGCVIVNPRANQTHFWLAIGY